MEELRSNGVEITGQSAFNQGDRQAFASALDKLIAKHLKNNQVSPSNIK